MSSLFDNLKGAGTVLEGDARDAAFRLAGKQFVKLTREPLVALLAGHLGKDDPAIRAKISDFLDTDLGGALVATLLSLGLSMLPAGVGGDTPPRLARELRVQAMTDVGDVVADLLMGPLRQVIGDLLRGEELKALPAESVGLTKVPELGTPGVEAPAESTKENVFPVPRAVSSGTR